MFNETDRYGVAMVVGLAVTVLTTFVVMAHALRHFQVFH